MTTLTHSQENIRQANLLSDASASHETGQILHLKRLLVTMKQHYEKALHSLHAQLQAEQNQRITSQKDLEDFKERFLHGQKLHEEEQRALRDQQTTLKELLKKEQNELERFRCQQIQEVHSESDIPYLKGCLEQSAQEVEQLKKELEGEQSKLKILEKELLENKLNARREVERFQQLLNAQKEDQIETVVSSTSSHYLRRELEEIKQNLAQGNLESKALETRYIEILNEKIRLEHQCKQLQMQLEHQSSNLTSFQTQLHEMGDHKKSLEMTLQAKEIEWEESRQLIQLHQKRIEDLNENLKEKEYIQDQYEQLKEEWQQLSGSLEEMMEGRAHAERRLEELETLSTHQEVHLKELEKQLQSIQQEKQSVEAERDQLKILLEDNEARLKAAQQHLAKKVKETALLSEKMEEQQSHFVDLIQNIEHQKTQIAQLQASVELYQRQEQRLQEQLHEALKGNESQVSKWEEKYFQMCDKWQESENKIRELKKFEEKHQQMQSLLANLGNFMGGSIANSHHPFFQEPLEPRSNQLFSENLPLERAAVASKIEETQQEKYNIFGMRQSHDSSNSHPSS